MDKHPDERPSDGARLFRPMQAVGLSFASFVAAFFLFWASGSTDMVSFPSRLAVLLLPVALGFVPVFPIGAFVRRRTWSASPVPKIALGLYVSVLLAAGGALNSRGFGISGPPSPETTAPDPASSS